ncbi:MAG: tRNA pseudouridine(55) synthase TruB [Clostridiales bacterium]
MEGIINVLKPPGMTSHDVISFLRRTLGEKKIGHCGTLDPQAAGVLPVCLGQATKLADYLSGGEKSYYGELELGYETDTQDIWGERIRSFSVPALESARDLAGVQRAAGSLEGRILQEVPAFSAVKKQGQSLHRLARKGEVVSGMAREVFIRSFQILECRGSTIRFIVECGSGTYVRMLCRDLARLLDSGGAMSFLLRLSVGPCFLANSFTLEEIRQHKEDKGSLSAEMLAPKELALFSLPQAIAAEGEAARLRQGQTLWLRASEFPTAEAAASKGCVLDQEGRLVALGSWQAGYGDKQGWILFKPDKTFN